MTSLPENFFKLEEEAFVDQNGMYNIPYYKEHPPTFEIDTVIKW